jgi:geranyl-CoA carboxylase alpha subunit
MEYWMKFKRILIANRGEIARRVIRTANAMGIETVAVYSEPDVLAIHVREATCAFALGGVTSADSYLRIDRLLQAAHSTGADAVHPGYGFLSEDAGFAMAVRDAGLAWIGPPPEAIRSLASKSAAKALATAQGVPCLPGYAGNDQNDARFAMEARRVGYPLMVKAVAGGGGRGMRLVHDPAQLFAALASARSEAQASFGNGELLIEQALLHPRHVELQVFADMHGACIHLGERDCSVQRRHQKIIEEAPSPAVDAQMRQRMGACAVALAQGAGYVGAGTVEFLVDGGEFFLMEMNTRLQVEHPVTEALTGLDLVEWQIRVAQGEPLPLAQHEVQFNGHAIEVRLCAEDEYFTPHTGRVMYLSGPTATQFCSTPLTSVAATAFSLRFDSAIEDGTEVTPHYDPMLGKLIVHANTRQAAIDHLVMALEKTELLGLPTNRAFLAACLDHPQFRAGEALISFIASQAETLRKTILEKERQASAGCGLAVVFSPTMKLHSLACPFPRPLRLRHRDKVIALKVRDLGVGHLLLQSALDGSLPDQRFRMTGLPNGAVQCTLDGVARPVRVQKVGERRWHLQAGAVDWWIEDESMDAIASARAAINATELRAPFNGRIVSVAAVAGQILGAGDIAVVIESMKLEHCVVAVVAATVADVLVSIGQQVSPGQILVRFSKIEVAA